MKKRGYPVTIPLLPGLKWAGKMRIDGVHENGYLAQFDAEIVGAKEGDQRIVYDRTVLSRKQVIDWTGVDLEAAPS